MKYIINSTIIFDTVQYTLKSLHHSNNTTPPSIKLSNSAGKVLTELIEHRNTGIPVTREHLFSVVWKTYGLIPSNGNLNQQISLIRKTLISLGLNALSIITIPKKGLKLNDQLIIRKIEHEKPHHFNISSKKISGHDQIQNFNLSSPILLNFKEYIKYTTTIMITIIILLSIGCTYFYTKTNNIKLYCCKEINSCDICSFNTTSDIECKNYTLQPSEIT